jgi:hypothetical protein
MDGLSSRFLDGLEFPAVLVVLALVIGLAGLGAFALDRTEAVRKHFTNQPNPP